MCICSLCEEEHGELSLYMTIVYLPPLLPPIQSCTRISLVNIDGGPPNICSASESRDNSTTQFHLRSMTLNDEFYVYTFLIITGGGLLREDSIKATDVPLQEVTEHLVYVDEYLQGLFKVGCSVSDEFRFCRTVSIDSAVYRNKAASLAYTSELRGIILMFMYHKYFTEYFVTEKQNGDSWVFVYRTNDDFIRYLRVIKWN